MEQVKSSLGELLHGGRDLAAQRLLESCTIGCYGFLFKYGELLHYSTQLCPQVLFFSP